MSPDSINDPVTLLVAGGGMLCLIMLGILLWDSYYRGFRARLPYKKWARKRGELVLGSSRRED